MTVGIVQLFGARASGPQEGGRDARTPGPAAGPAPLPNPAVVPRRAIWRVPLWPRSLAARVATVLLVGLIAVQSAGLLIHALDRIGLQRLAQARDIASSAMAVYRTVVLTPPAQRETALRELDVQSGLLARLQPAPPAEMEPMPQPEQRSIRVNLALLPLPGPLRPHEIVMRGEGELGRVHIGMRLPDGPWLNIRIKLSPISPFHSATFLIAFVLMTVVAAALTIWAVRELTAPVATLAAAAERLGRDVNASPLPEGGPSEVATAAAAFNLMAERIRRFVSDRTLLLAAIGHDLRTPITRLKLRAEFMEDEELRRRMIADLEELEQMVSATLAFSRDATASEPMTAIDLAELARTVMDEAADARPELADHLNYNGPAHLTVRARSLGLKRALANLIANALSYGGSAHVTISPPQGNMTANTAGSTTGDMITVEIDDDGPGIPPAELDRVFQPFHRVEPSRNRETGGMGLGLPIARNILRAHGGDVTIVNRPAGGARATVSLPI